MIKRNTKIKSSIIPAEKKKDPHPPPPSPPCGSEKDGIDTPVLRIPEETPDDKPETVFWIGFNNAFSSCFRTVAILITPRVSFSVFFLMPLDLSQDQTEWTCNTSVSHCPYTFATSHEGSKQMRYE